MTDERVFHHTLDNGLALVCEEMDGVESAAITLLVPAGAANDPAEAGGMASMLTDMIFRGAGQRDSRQLTDHLDGLGLQRGESAQTYHTCLSAATLGRSLGPTLEAYADVIRRPHLPAEQLPAVQALAVQRLDSLEDEPRQKVLVELRARHYPAPLGRNVLGRKDHIEAVTPEVLRADFERRYRPNGAILGIAGKVRWDDVRQQVTNLFDDWEPSELPEEPLGTAGRRIDHIDQETTQTQIGIAYASVPPTHDDYYTARLAVAVLSGGSSGRLFTEVREKRSLCYAVYAAYHSLKGRGSVVCYAGTTNERAQETLDVTLGELGRLADGVEADELRRARAGLKSTLVMQGESTTARSTAVAVDWFHLGRVRSIEEIAAGIDAVTPDAVGAHLQAVPPGPYTVLTLGPRPLEVAC